MKQTILSILIALCALAGSWQTAWATETVTLSVDPDIAEGTAGHWYVNLPYHDTNKLTLSAVDLAAGKNVFKVYDDGGKNGNYSKDADSYLSITIPDGYGFFVTGTVCTAATKDYLKFSAGDRYSEITSALRSDTDGEVKSIKPVILSNNSVLWIQLIAFNLPTHYAGLDLTVTIVNLSTDFPVSTSTPSHGTLAVDKTTAKLGETVTVTPAPSTNFSTAEVSYTVGTTKYVIEPDNGTYSFTMHAGDVTVGAKFLDEVGYLWGEDADVAGGIITHGAVNATFSNLSMEGTVNHDYVFQAAPQYLINCFVNVSRTGDGGFKGLSSSGFAGTFASTNCAYLLEGLPASFAFGEDVIQPTGTYEVVLNGGATAVRTGGIAIGNGTATLYADGFSYGGTEYFKKDATVTLGADLPSGYSLTGYTVTGPTPSEDNTFSMPSHGVTVTAHSARTDYVTHWQASMAIDGADGSSASGIAVVPPANDADGDVRAPGWYTLDGVRLNGKPTKKGLYIHGGRKVVIP